MKNEEMSTEEKNEKREIQESLEVKEWLITYIDKLIKNADTTFSSLKQLFLTFAGDRKQT